MKKHVETEIKVGLFICIGLGLVMTAFLVVGGDSMLARKNKYTAHFSSIDGLTLGSKVTLGGVPVGTVESIDFDFTQHDIVVQFSVIKRATEWVHVDSFVEITSQGVLGDKYITITAGEPTSSIIPDGSNIPIRAEKNFTEIFSKGDQLMGSLNSIASSLQHILRSFETDNRNTTFFRGISETAKNLSQASDKLNREIDQIHLKHATAALTEILQKINNGTGSIGALINDPSLYDEMKALFGGVNRNRIMRNLIHQAIKDADAQKTKTDGH
jgi:phospholipid/cholesterol/gamma-HCH transport system substrate-binding protein